MDFSKRKFGPRQPSGQRGPFQHRPKPHNPQCDLFPIWNLCFLFRTRGSSLRQVGLRISHQLIDRVRDVIELIRVYFQITDGAENGQSPTAHAI